MKTKINHKTRFNVPNRINNQLLSINDDYLQVNTLVNSSFSLMGYAGWWFLYSMSIPFFILIGIKIFHEVSVTDPDIVRWVTIYSGVIVFFTALGPGFSWLYARKLKRNTQLIFDRKNQIIRMVQMGILYECPWNNVRGSIEVKMSTAGVVVSQDTVIVLKLKPVKNLSGKALTKLEKNPANALIEASYDSDGYDGCEMAWEFICEFMQHGPESLEVPKRLYYPLSSKTTRTSISFREAVSYHWPFPPYRKNEPTSLQVIKTILLPVRLAFYITNVLADGCWHWMMNWGKPKMLLPEQEKAQQQAITPDMVFNILGKDKEFMPYSEAKVRLFGKTQAAVA